MAEKKPNEQDHQPELDLQVEQVEAPPSEDKQENPVQPAAKQAKSKQVKKTTKEHETTSTDLLWKYWFNALELWEKQATRREDMLLASLSQWEQAFENYKENTAELAAQINKEARIWEKLAREEWLSATSGIRYLFPYQSFEETNRTMDTIYDRTRELSVRPMRYSFEMAKWASGQWRGAVERMIEYRRKNRERVISSLKNRATQIQMNQGSLLEEHQKLVKNIFFPINCSMEQSEDMVMKWLEAFAENNSKVDES